MDKIRGNAVRLLQNYLRFWGVILLSHGIVTLLLSDLSIELPDLLVRLLRTDPTHAVIHVLWGAMLLWQVQLTQKSTRLKQQYRSSRLGFMFSAFYLGLGLLGSLFRHPMGLQLDRGENAFHVLVGSVALLLSLIVLYPGSKRPQSTFE